eukprot:GILI01031640.1.p1 GENE.GILI01031640.1~~GILI01031640.1.p1  ORF type:complete len:591 (+),score=98.38 GILI01031640.1:94-1773(+)
MTSVSSRQSHTTTHIMVKEDTALSTLKSQLGVNYTVVGMNPPADAIDGYLMRYIRNADLSVPKTIESLRQRREFEKAFPGVSVTPYLVSSLRSGAFSVIGEDVMHRPILHIRLSNFRSSTDSYDSERLLFVILEYMQSLAMRHFSSAGVNGNGDSDAAALQGVSNALNNGTKQSRPIPTRSSSASSPSTAQSQEIIILLQDDSNSSSGVAGGIFANRGQQLVSKISEVATKFFQNLVGAIMMVDVNWAVQQGMRTNQAVREVLQVVKEEHLPRFIDPQIIPEDLGGKKVKTSNKGRHRTCVEASNPIDFSQIVLRHWFNTVTVLAAEETSRMARPLWQPLPVYFNLAATTTGGASSGFAESGMRQSMGQIGSYVSEGQSFGHTNSAVRRRGFGNSSIAGSSARGGQFGEEDDGVCSVMTDEHTIEESDEHAMMPLDEEGTKGLQAELNAERSRRVQLENELSKLTLGITLDDSTLTRLEVALKAVHGDVNVLISEVVQRSKATTTGVAGRAASGGPSLPQLLEATNRAVLQTLQEREEVPAMQFAQPTERRAKKTCVIS